MLAVEDNKFKVDAYGSMDGEYQEEKDGIVIAFFKYSFLLLSCIQRLYEQLLLYGVCVKLEDLGS